LLGGRAVAAPVFRFPAPHRIGRGGAAIMNRSGEQRLHTPPPGNPRAFAVGALLDRFERSRSLAAIFGTPAFLRMPLADRLLARELVDGVLRALSLLDHLILRLSNRPLSRIEPVILWILRVSIYQMRFLRVPDYAAIHEGTGLCGGFGRAHARGFVNALLRQYQRRLPEPPRGDSVGDLAVRFSHPPWLVARWLKRFGLEELKGLLERNNLHPPSTVWVNPFRLPVEDFCERLGESGVAYAKIDGLPHAVRVDHRGFVRHELYRAGNCFFMDRSSQLVAYSSRLEGRRRLADLCAAPGGKSFILRHRAEPRASLVSIDPHGGRLRDMRARAAGLGIGGIDHLVADAAARLPFGREFDFVLADVPCSGLGTLRTNPDIRWFVVEEDLKRYQERQVRILGEAFRILAPGGELLYSTCSTEPEENERVVEALLSRDPEAAVEEEPIRTFPRDEGGDGFFIARILRRR
jgi:16S rRNA (cytosine967-C5)-methyltransferase